MSKGRLAFLLAVLLTTLFWAGPAGAAPGRQEPVVHVVQPGQNLFRIALRYGTTVDAIVAANSLADARTVYTGQRLVIPVAAERAATPDGSYVVQPGDTLTRIALRHGVSVQALVQANGLADAHAIRAGQRLVVPGVGTEPPEMGTGPPEVGTESPEMGTGPPEVGTGSTDVSEPARTYVVRSGDSLEEIARGAGVAPADLARWNGVANPTALQAGQVLRLTKEVPLPPGGGPKRILIDLSEQHLYAYAGERLVYSFVASSGAAPNYTRAGEFRVQSKVPNAYGSAWNIWMPHWLGIYWAGSTENGIHALPILPNGQTLWAGYLGRPVSYGCIVLGTYEAQLLYDWAEIGTPVSIRH